MATADWAHAASIDDVLERMAAIDADLPQDDGVAYFNRMYWQVTKLVDEAVDSSTFEAGEFLARLDVHFANRFFEAYAADLDGTIVSADAGVHDREGQVVGDVGVHASQHVFGAGEVVMLEGRALDRIFRQGLARSVLMASRGILL